MIVALVVILLVLIGIAAWVIGRYNTLIRLRNACDNSWGLVDVQLKRRSDLIPNLVATVQGYASHERSTLEAVIEARRQVDGSKSVADQQASEGVLTQALGRLIALQEAYPDLKADKSFLSLQGELATTENSIAYSRQAYNDTATRYNNAIQTFPGSLIAGPAMLTRRDLFVAPASAMEVPRVDFAASAPADADPCCSEGVAPVIPGNYREDLLEALPGLLFAPGEQLIAHCTTYSPNFKAEVVFGQVKQVYKGASALDIALTNINLRWFTYKAERVKTGFLKYETHALPELAQEGSVALSRITTAKSSQDRLRPEVARHFRKMFGRDVGVCTFLTVNWEGGFLSQFSPFDNFPVLIKDLDLARSGAALSSTTTTVADAVQRLALLRGEGVLTDEEFDRAKGGFLGSTVEVVESSASILRQLYALKQSGVLSDSEFSMKKWDVLSQPR